MLMKPSDEAAKPGNREVRPGGDLVLLAVLGYLGQVATKRSQRMGGRLALGAQVVAVTFHMRLHRQRTGRTAPVKRGSTRPSTSAICARNSVPTELR